MKICFIVGTLGRGGAEKQLVLMLRALESAGVESRVLCLTKGESHEAEIKSLGIEVEYVGERQNRLARLWQIAANLRKNRPNIIQSSHFYTNIYAALAGKALRIPTIGAIRNNLTSEVKLHGLLGRFQISLPDFLIANSDSARSSALARGIAPHKIAFVRNAVESIAKEGKPLPQQNGKITFLFAGRLTTQKRPDRFVRLAAALTEKFPARDLLFRIAGDGALRAEVERQVKDSVALENKFEFLGECSEMSEVYRQSDVLVLTSDYEGTPNVVLEAMSHGLPVVATKAGGTAEILTEKCGILVDTEDENELLEAAGKLVESPELRFRLGSEGLRYIQNNHSLESLRAHLTEIYANLIEHPAKSARFEEAAAAEKISSR